MQPARPIVKSIMADAVPDFKVVIPARYASTRLPGKPLLPIAGRPMIAHVCERALQANASEVVVATDDERILRAARALNVRCVMTRTDHNSGTERIAEVAEHCGWASSDLIVNVQGDEPLLPPPMIQSVAAALASQTDAGIATVATPIKNPEDLLNPNVVKVVLDRRGYALYFSRAPIPWHREGFAHGQVDLNETFSYFRHIGLYAYTTGFLQRYLGWPTSPLESLESLEQLRVLWNGAPVRVSCVDEAPPPGVDTEEDRQRVERIIGKTQTLGA